MEAIGKMKKQPTEWEKIFTHDVSDNIQNTYHSIGKKQIAQLKNRQKVLSRHFSKKIHKWPTDTWLDGQRY